MTERVTYLVAVERPDDLTREALRMIVHEAVHAAVKAVSAGKDPRTLTSHHPTVRPGRVD
jgi:hypothetical protein